MAPSSQGWIFPFLHLHWCLGCWGYMYLRSSQLPWQESCWVLPGVASCVGSLSCCLSDSVVVTWCRHVNSVGSALAAIMPLVDTSGVVLDMLWARKKFRFHKLGEKEWVGVQSLVQISCCMLAFCGRKLIWPRRWVVWSWVSETIRYLMWSFFWNKPCVLLLFSSGGKLQVSKL